MRSTMAIQNSIGSFNSTRSRTNGVAERKPTWGVVGSTVVGYYAHAVGSVEQEAAPERMKKGLAKHAIPIMLLARLAVDRHWQKRGIGAALLKDAVLRTLQAADIAGIRALVVHAKDDAAKGFYRRFDFIPSSTDPLHLFLLLKDLRQISA